MPPLSLGHGGTGQLGDGCSAQSAVSFLLCAQLVAFPEPPALWLLREAGQHSAALILHLPGTGEASPGPVWTRHLVWPFAQCKEDSFLGIGGKA